MSELGFDAQISKCWNFNRAAGISTEESFSPRTLCVIDRHVVMSVTDGQTLDRRRRQNPEGGRVGGRARARPPRAAITK